MSKYFNVCMNGNVKDLNILLHKHRFGLFKVNYENKVDYKGWTGLHYASKFGNKEIVELLLHRGVNIESEDKDGFTPLYYAVEFGRNGVVEILLQHGANIENKDKNGYSLLNRTSKLGNKYMVEILLKHGANIESKDKDGFTPLLNASYYNSMDKGTVEILLQHGADIKARTSKGYTALDLAKKEGHYHTVQLLSEYIEMHNINLSDTEKTVGSGIILPIIEHTDYAKDKISTQNKERRTTTPYTQPSIKCPKCYSTQIHADKKGYGLGKGVTGAVLLGPAGLLGGFVGKNAIFLTCLNCGHKWKPGNSAE